MAEAPSARGDHPSLRLGAYEGPLDLLLELARAQRVDLAQLPVVPLAEQFAAALDRAIAARAVPLGMLGEWLVTAAALLALRARLLLPAGTAESREAEREAEALRRRLADRVAVRGLAAWLERRPQLGREVFARAVQPAEAPGPAVADVTELLRACLRLLELPVRERIYRPAPPPLWRPPDAAARLRRMLPTLPAGGVPMTRLLPLAGTRMATPLQRRAAIASTLAAGLELAREGLVVLGQPLAFSEIRLGRRDAPAEAETARSL